MYDSADDVNFYMKVDPELKRRFREACAPSTMTEITQYLWRVFINAPDEEKYKTMKEASVK